MFFDTKSKVDLAGFQMRPAHTLVVDLTQELDTIWKKMSRKRARKGIKKAQRDGVRIKLNDNYDEFQDLNDSFRKKKGLSHDSESTSVLKRSGPLFVAEYDGEILCGDAFFADGNIIRWRLGASKRLVDLDKAALIGNANRLLVWVAIKYAKGKGLREFDIPLEIATQHKWDTVLLRKVLVETLSSATTIRSIIRRFINSR
jgi:hypothetical protein